MSALKYLDPFPVLIVGSLVVVAGLWVWRAVTHETSE